MTEERFPRRDFLKATATRPADFILKNAKIITVDANFSIAQAIAIAGERIVAVGEDAAMAPHIAPATRIIDLKGKSVIPGLIDGHAHMDREGLKSIYPSLGSVRSIQDIQDRIAELARKSKPGEWVVTMPIGDPPYYFNVPEFSLKSDGQPAKISMPPPPTIPCSSARSGVSGVTPYRWFPVPILRL